MKIPWICEGLLDGAVTCQDEGAVCQDVMGFGIVLVLLLDGRKEEGG